MGPNTCKPIQMVVLIQMLALQRRLKDMTPKMPQIVPEGAAEYDVSLSLSLRALGYENLSGKLVLRRSGTVSRVAASNSPRPFSDNETGTEQDLVLSLTLRSKTADAYTPAS